MRGASSPVTGAGVATVAGSVSAVTDACAVLRHSDGWSGARSSDARARRFVDAARVWAPTSDSIPSTAVAVSFLGMVFSSIPPALVDEAS